jgi:phenylpropionate dioxygenase-like ring-hydroxylating dioxygenase large terminal subunit
MLSAADNELLTRTGKGTRGGEFFRRFWLPALLSEEVPSPDCAPVRVRLMGERLVAFRNTSGGVGLVGQYCMHRQMDLFFGRNEENGLRCLYHGWKYDIEGNCVDMPTERPESTYKNRIHLTAYPCKEYAGIVWAYLGPKDLAVEFPEFEFNNLPASNYYIRKSLLQCNYLQAMEGNLDSSHVGFLHSFPKGSAGQHGQPAAKAPVAKDTAGTNVVETRLAELEALKKMPSFEIKETDFGFIIGAKRPNQDGTAYWRIAQWLLPVHTMVGSNEGETLLWDAWVPLDDENTWVYRIMYNPWRPISEHEKWQYNNVGVMMLNVENIPGTYLPLRNRGNDYLIDRVLQKNYSYSGIKGTNAQDAAAIENQGPTPIADRTLEHLGNGDTGIRRMRARMLKEISAFQNGVEPVAAFKGSLYRVRPITLTMPDDGVPFYEAASHIITV